MKNQQSYSHGLLYSIAPDNFSSLHLNDDVRKKDFQWEYFDAEADGDSFTRIVYNFLRTTAVNWGILKLH